VNRRSFLGTTLAAVFTIRYQKSLLGIELTAYDETTLRALADIGYRDVAVNDLYAPGLRESLSRVGLAASAVHVTTPLLYRGLDRHLSVAAAMGCRYFVCGRLDPEERRTEQDWHELAALFNRSGDAAKKAGLRFAYRIQGSEIDLMMRETDAALVWFEGPAPRARFFAMDVTDHIVQGVEHYYVQAKSLDAARASYLSLSRLKS
jgi:hypothetical protein